MKDVRQNRCCITLRVAVTFIVLLFGWNARADSSAPSVDEILKKLAEHADDPGSGEHLNTFGYQRMSRVEYLDEHGKVKNQVVRLYRVTPAHGKPVTRLVSINGRPATEKDERNRSAARETGDKSRSLKFSSDLLARFHFVLRGSDFFMNRPVWALDFSPKPDAENNRFMDRLINAMAGTIWVDQSDFQMAKAQIRLSKKVSFFGGLAGTIEHLDMNVIQKRVEPDVWLPEALTLDFAGRKLFSPIRFRCFENCSDFQNTESIAAGSGPPAEKQHSMAN